jgi:predicted nuclease with TOPRIM domain
MTNAILEQSTEKMSSLVNENHDLRKENAQLRSDVETLTERIGDMSKQMNEIVKSNIIAPIHVE